MASAGNKVFQPQTASVSASAPTNVPQTVRAGPASALTAPNDVISTLPATSGQT